MLGLSTRMKRNELLHMKATGTPRALSAATMLSDCWGGTTLSS